MPEFISAVDCPSGSSNLNPLIIAFGIFWKPPHTIESLKAGLVNAGASMSLEVFACFDIDERPDSLNV